SDLERDAGAVRIDATQFDQMIVNLVVNARDAIGSSGRILIRTRKKGGEVSIAIVDDGAGMTEEVKSKIFDPFFTTKEVGKGTGLGLSTVYGIVQQSGGFIFAESEVGKGTEFRIFLPVHA